MPHQHHTHPEATERTDTPALPHTPKHPAKFAAFPQDWQQHIARAKELQKATQCSDGDFAGTILSGPAWNQLFNGAYPLPSTPAGEKKMTAKLALLVTRGQELLARQAEPTARLSIAQRYVMRPEYEDILGCLEDAATNAADDLEERVVLIVGPTRSGKSWTLAKLKAEQKAHWHLRASPGMKRSYRRFLLGIAAALSLRDLEERNIDTLERDILKRMSRVQGVLAIEELQRFSPSALEFLKMLLNESQVTIVIFMLPGQYTRMTRSTGEDMQQFLGRSAGVVRLQVTEQLVTDYKPELWKACPNAAELKALVRNEALKGGGMSLVRDVLNDAWLLAKSEGLKTHHVHDALKAFRHKIPTMKEAA